MRPSRLIPIAVLALAAACNDTTTTSPTSELGPQFAVAAGTYVATFNDAFAPQGTHVQTGTPSCTVSELTISCPSYELAGVGNTNARADLNAAYTATVDCRNHGGQVVAVKAQAEEGPFTTGRLEPKNGKLAVPALSTAGQVPSNSDFTSQATCPNGNWTKEVRGGTITLASFTYTLTFARFSGAYITISAP